MRRMKALGLQMGEQKPCGLDGPGSPFSSTTVPVSQEGVAPLRLSPPVSSPLAREYMQHVDYLDGVPCYQIREDCDVRPIDLPVHFDYHSNVVIPADATTDCGALMNTISWEFYSMNVGRFGELEDPDFHFRLANGSRVHNRGSITLPLVVVHRESLLKYSVRFQVMESEDNWQILLGKPWLWQAKAKVDYGSDTLTIETEDGPKVWHGQGWEHRIADRSHEPGTIRLVATDGSQENTDYVVQHEIKLGANEEEPRMDQILAKITIGSELDDTKRQRVIDLIRKHEKAFALDLAEVIRLASKPE
jgi:hypothetical protein